MQGVEVGRNGFGGVVRREDVGEERELLLPFAGGEGFGFEQDIDYFVELGVADGEGGEAD